MVNRGQLTVNGLTIVTVKVTQNIVSNTLLTAVADLQSVTRLNYKNQKQDEYN